jgi:outer membrane protein TolC
MRRKSWYWGLALLLMVSAGCKQQVFLTLDDAERYKSLAMVGASEIENNPRIIDKPLTDICCRNPRNVDDLDRTPRYISLAEAIAIALEQGNTGQQGLFTSPSISGLTTLNGGLLNDAFVTFNGPGVALNSDNIRVLSLSPASTGANIESSLSKFDANWVTSANWQTIDRPVATSQDTLTAQGIVPFISTETATVSTAVVKPLSTGGVVGITFNETYTNTNQPALINPAYQPTLTFSIEQPLLQGFGTEINELRAAHPGSIVNPNTANLTTPQTSQEGILVSRVRFDESRAEFERAVDAMVVNVEFAYWRLYGSYWNLYSNEQGMRQAYEAWKISAARLAAGRISRADYAQARGQYELFRGQRIDSLETILENERQLRGLLGMHAEDGCRLIPSDSPTLSPYAPDWCSGLNEALTLRPELYIARQEVKVAQMNLVVAKDNLLPDLRFFANWDINGVGTRLDGPDANENANRSLASDRFHNWNVGLRYNVPIGFRLANSNLRIARLTLVRALDVLTQEELKTERFLWLVYRQITYQYEKMKVTRARREAFAEQLDAQFRIYQAGKGTLDLLLEAQRNWAAALLDEYTAISLYQQSLAAWEWAKGTLLHHDNIIIGEGELPCCVAQRAVEHLKERTAACVAKEQPATDLTPHGCKLATLPAAFKAVPPMKDLPPVPDPTAGASGTITQDSGTPDPMPATLPNASAPGTPLSQADAIKAKLPLPPAPRTDELPPGVLQTPSARTN